MTPIFCLFVLLFPYRLYLTGERLLTGLFDLDKLLLFLLPPFLPPAFLFPLGGLLDLLLNLRLLDGGE